MTNRAGAASATKARIVDCAATFAATSLFNDTTLESIAQCAATTVRTVLRLFGSKEQLFSAALDSIGFENFGPVSRGDLEGTLTTVYDFYEKHGDMVIRWLADEPRVAAMREHFRIGRRNLRVRVSEAFAPSLGLLEEPARQELLNGLIVALDVYTWKLVRRDFGLSRRAAQAVTWRILKGLIDGHRQ